VIVALLIGAAVALTAWAVSRARRMSPLDRPDARGERRAPSLKRLSIVFATGVAGYAIGGLVGAALGLVAGIAARAIGERRAKKVSRQALDEQLADAIGAVSSAVRAGLSVPQAFAYAASEAEEPLRSDLDLLVHDVEIGTPLDAAVRGWTERVATDDAVLFSSAVDLNRRVGGDLPIVLDQVGATIRDRVAAAREVRALTAQARLSGLILGLLPVGFFAFLWMTSRTEMQQAISTPAGVISIVLGLVMEVAAFLWIRKLLEVG
jgi:tight adherence protein B